MRARGVFKAWPVLAPPAAAACLLALSSSASGQAGQSARQQWQVDYGEFRCTLSRRFGEPAPITLGVKVSPSDGTIDLVAMNPAWLAEDDLPDQVEVVVRPSELRFSARARSGSVRSGGHRFMRMSRIDPAFLASLETASALSLEANGRELMAVEVTGGASAVRALRTCHNHLLRRWGVDTALLEGLRRPPTPLGDTARSMESDEPLDPGTRGLVGFIVVRFTIGTSGRISTCDIVRSSGSMDADQAVCSLIRRTARYEPALGPDGQPVAVQLVQTFNIVRRPS